MGHLLPIAAGSWLRRERNTTNADHAPKVNPVALGMFRANDVEIGELCSHIRNPAGGGAVLGKEGLRCELRHLGLAAADRGVRPAQGERAGVAARRRTTLRGCCDPSRGCATA